MFGDNRLVEQSLSQSLGEARMRTINDFSRPECLNYPRNAGYG